MNIQISDAASQRIAAALAEQHLEPANLPESVSMLIQRVAADEALLRSLMLGGSLSETDLSESLSELDLAFSNVDEGHTRPAKEALSDVANELELQISR